MFPIALLINENLNHQSSDLVPNFSGLRWRGLGALGCAFHMLDLGFIITLAGRQSGRTEPLERMGWWKMRLGIASQRCRCSPQSWRDPQSQDQFRHRLLDGTPTLVLPFRAQAPPLRKATCLSGSSVVLPCCPSRAWMMRISGLLEAAPLLLSFQPNPASSAPLSSSTNPSQASVG